MAARHHTRLSDPAVHQTAKTRRPERWTLTEPAEPVPSSIRQGLVGRVIYFPESWLNRVETRPGALIELLTLAIAAYQAKGGAQ